MLYGVIAGMFKELDRNAATHAEGAPVESARVEYLEAALNRAEGYFRRAAQRRAQSRYLAGVIGGLTVIAGVGFLLSLGLSMLPDLQDQSGMYLASLIAGGMGALLSVLYGMTSGNLRLHTLFANAESSRGPLVAAGALRPLRRRALGHRRLRAAAERLHPAQGAGRRRGYALLHRDRDRGGLQRALGARRAGGHRGAHPERDLAKPDAPR